MALADTVAAISGASALAGAAVAFAPLKRHFTEERRQAQRIEDSILGVKASETLPAVPSIFAVVSDLANRVDEIRDLTRQLKPNGGSSLADEIRRSAHKLDKVQEQLEEHRVEFIRHLEAHNGEANPTSSEDRRVPKRVRPSTPKVLEQPTKEKGEER